MAYIDWKDGYATGIQEIDRQHFGLITYINMLHSAMEEGKGEDVLTYIIKQLQKYTIEHFGTEEHYMIKHEYPLFANHKHEHQSFIADIDRITKEKSSNTTKQSVELLYFLRNWLINHIEVSDKKMAESFTKL